MVRLRAFGNYAYHLADPKLFYQTISGTKDLFTTEDIESQLRNTLIGSIADLFGESGISFIDMAGNQDEFGAALKQRLQPTFASYGLVLDSLVVQNVSLPEELQKVLDTRISMNVLGDMGRYTQYQVANSIPDAARNEGGLAGIGAGLGAGMGIGQAFAQAAQPAPAASADDVMATLEKLHGLLTKGILSQAEFDEKKAELLKKLG
jgi:membrane protease subunit (stomatin/prohibitin family)